jgi:outer membrane protein assembly factor BamD (BamD/ComL family)
MNNQQSILFTVLVFAGLFSMANLIQAQGQNYTSVTSTEFESIRTSLDQAIAAFNEGNLSEAYEQLEKTENQMEIVESRIIFELGIE